MPVACQVMKPLCLLIGVEKHVCLGLSPLGPPLPNPNEICISVGVIDMPLGDPPSGTVTGDAARFIKRGHDSKFFRPHFSTGLPPLPSAVPPPLDLGLMAIVIGFGQAKSVWGPYSIKADFGDAANPAVIYLAPGLCVGAMNFTMCSEPVPKMNIKGMQIIPNVFNVQMPTTVFAGMTLADAIGNIVGVIADVVLSKLLEVIFKYVPGLKQLKEVADKVVEKIVGKALKPLLRVICSKITDKAMEKAEGRLEAMAGLALSDKVKKEMEDKIEKMVDKKLDKGVEDAGEKFVDKLIIEKAAAPLAEQGVETSSDAAKEGTEKLFGEEGEEGGGKEGEGKESEGKEAEGGAKEADGAEGAGNENQAPNQSRATNQSEEPPGSSGNRSGPGSE